MINLAVLRCRICDGAGRVLFRPRRGDALMKRTPIKSRPTLLDPAIRQQLAQRAEYGCERCGWITQHGHAHHRRLRSQGGLDTLANLLWLCNACHGAIHALVRSSVDAGWLVSAYADPAQVPVLLHGRRWVLLGDGYTDLPEEAS